MTEILQNAHFWVGVALVLFTLILLRVGAFGAVAKMLDARAAKIQDQLNEATHLREEAQALLADIQTQKIQAEATAKEIMASAKAEAKRLQADSKVKLEEQIKRRGEMAERRIAQAEVQAAADVKAAAADLAAQTAEAVLVARLAGAKSDPLIDQAVSQLAGKLQ